MDHCDVTTTIQAASDQSTKTINYELLDFGLRILDTIISDKPDFLRDKGEAMAQEDMLAKMKGTLAENFNCAQGYFGGK